MYINGYENIKMFYKRGKRSHDFAKLSSEKGRNGTSVNKFQFLCTATWHTYKYM